VTAPDPKQIDRAALDRIIQRAAELQTGEREIGDSLTPDEVMSLGKEVGIPARYLRQAMLEHQSLTPTLGGGTVVGRWVGPAEIEVQRVVQGGQQDVLRSLMAWMEKNELLVLQRQQPGWASWEPLRGMQAAIRRGTASLDTSKPKFMLSRAETVIGTVTPLEPGYCHVTLAATLRRTRAGYLGGAVTLGTVGVMATGILVALSAFPLVAVAPLLPAALASVAVLRSFRPVAARVQLGLERALDFLERGGVKPGHEAVPKSPGLLDLLAGEVRRALTTGEGHAREARRRGRLRGPDAKPRTRNDES
jgi:hypothetical protein